MKATLAVMSILIATLMLAMPLSSASNTVYVTDREGDLGKTWYTVSGDPVSWWSGDSPISNAGYLDILAGWITVKNKQVQMGVLVKDPIAAGTLLPDGVKEVRWAWYFYVEPTHWYADYYAFIAWDGIGFTAAIKDITGLAEPFPVIYLNSDSIAVEGNVLTLTVDSSILPGVNWWFFESQVYKNLWPLEGWARYGGWHAPDLTDGPNDTMLPWWPMP
ncbi:MAG TPA: hypothetical protein VF374_07750 [Thermoplasmata archaeon]|jgi:hypothetical protein